MTPTGQQNADGQPLTVTTAATPTDQRPTEQSPGISDTLDQELHDFFENASVGLHWVGSDGIIQRANRAELELLGYGPDEYVGQHIAKFHVDQEVIDNILLRLSRGETLCNYEARLRHKDGDIRYVLLNSNVLWRDGEFVHTRCFTRDITERKRIERRLVAEHAVSRVLAEAASLQEATPRILEALCNTTSWEWAAMWTVDAPENVLRCVSTWRLPNAEFPVFEQLSLRTRLQAGIGLPGQVWETARPVWITDVSVNKNFPRMEAAKSDGLHGGAAFPVLSGERVQAVMEFFSGQIKEPDDSLLAMMSAVGTQIGQFMDRMQTQKALRESEARNAAVLRSALDCLISMDARGLVVGWNPAAERTFGYSLAEAVGQQMAELIIPPQFREQHRKGLEHFLASGEGPILGKRLEITALRKDGGEFPVELAVTTIDCEGPAMFMGHLRDITEQKRAEEERKQLLVSERYARQQAEDANRMKDEFLSIVSHELRTPLNAILGWSQILDGKKVSEADLKEGVQVIQRNARVQTQIIEDILDMSRIISGKVRLDVQRVDLPTVIEAAIQSMQPAAEAKGIRLQIVLDPIAGPISGDPARIQQVVWNLISNAIKFTPKGGRVRVTLERVNSHVEVSVSDTGEGIKPEFLPHVFERFRQAESSTTRRHGGLGLGLSIVKQLVELHGGTIQAKSPGEGQGSTFRVALPFLPLHSEEEGNFRQHPTGKHTGIAACKAPSLRGVRVMLVDDEPDARHLLKRLLEQCEAEVRTASTVAEAILLLEEVKPDVIVSDIGMPDRDGYDLMQLVRSLPPENGGETPAVALTAFARSEDRTRAMQAGFDVHVAKPVESNELCAVVARLRNVSKSKA